MTIGLLLEALGISVVLSSPFLVVAFVDSSVQRERSEWERTRRARYAVSKQPGRRGSEPTPGLVRAPAPARSPRQHGRRSV